MNKPSAIIRLSGLPLAIVLMLALMLASPATAGEAGANASDRLRAASDTAYLVLTTALAEEDAGLLASIFSEEAKLISPNGQSISGRSAIHASAALLMLTMGGGELELTRLDLAMTDSTAHETGVYRFSQPADDDKRRTWTGRFAVLWILGDKTWKISQATGLP